MEYQLPRKTAGPPVFLFVVDACVEDDELDELKDSLQQSLNLLPETALVGFMTFGTMVHVHELGFSDCPKAYVFKGTKDYSAAQVQEMLGLGRGVGARVGGASGAGGAGGAPGGAAPASVTSRFLLPVSECGFALETVLEDLQRDPWPRAGGKRPARCTGVALSVAVSLLQKAVGYQGARIMMFIGGPATQGPGAVASIEQRELLRGHVDITKGNAPLCAPATKFYKDVAKRCVEATHVIDVFTCSLDQTGLLEMQSCVTQTGGLVVQADSFGQSVFKESFRRVFGRFDSSAPPCDAGHLTMGFAASLEVLTSKEFKVSGAIGPCSPLKSTSTCIGETEVGVGGTNMWAMGGVDPGTSLAIFFEVANSNAAAIPAGRRHHLQFITRYQHSSGRHRLRVTTVAGPWHSDPSTLAPVASSFDQEAAAVLMARIAVHRTETEDTLDILRWLDRSLIRLCARFADYHKDDPGSFRLSPSFSFYPQFMFHLRRSQFLQIFNMSPDESSYYRMTLNGVDVSNSLLMIQPSLHQYSFDGPPQPVMLDARSVRPNAMLLLDTFFHVVVFHGQTIAAWRDEGWADKPEHESFRRLLQAPQDDAQAIMASRFPFPRFIVCDQHKSQARFLMAKVNPSVTHASSDGGSGAAVFSDDVSLSVFMDHLMKLAVSS